MAFQQEERKNSQEEEGPGKGSTEQSSTCVELCCKPYRCRISPAGSTATAGDLSLKPTASAADVIRERRRRRPRGPLRIRECELRRRRPRAPPPSRIRSRPAAFVVRESCAEVSSDERLHGCWIRGPPAASTTAVTDQRAIITLFSVKLKVNGASVEQRAQKLQHYWGKCLIPWACAAMTAFSSRVPQLPIYLLLPVLLMVVVMRRNAAAFVSALLPRNEAAFTT
uniref:Uncharacterized protein n=1 Tax=Oryza meridionalis TaxID=40149 RepID=A0A0E0F220_9ORYZ